MHAIRLMMSVCSIVILTSIWCWVTSAKGWYIMLPRTSIVSIVSVSAGGLGKAENPRTTCRITTSY